VKYGNIMAKMTPSLKFLGIFSALFVVQQPSVDQAQVG
jgi:hypothetical protein